MSVRAPDRHIEILPGHAGGEPHLRGRRIKVRDIAVWHEHQGLGPDEIAAEYDLDLAEVYAALSWYFDHREQIDRSIAEHRRFVDELRKRSPSVLERKLSSEG